MAKHDYDLIVVPGGREAPERIRQIKEALTFIKEAHGSGVTIASICHGPWVLISAGIIKGKMATGYVGIKDDLINAGANYLDVPVAVDENIVTSPHFRDLPAWMKKTLEVYYHQAAKE